MAEAQAHQAEDGVLVTEQVAATFYGHLQEQGRVTSFTSPADVYTKLGTIMEREWATTNAKRFKDDPGGGWLIDISRYVDEEALHVLIRTVHGRRTVMCVVDEVEVEGFLEGNGWTTEAAQGLVPPGMDAEALAMAEAIESGKVEPARAPKVGGPQAVGALAPAPAPVASPDDPAMILVMDSAKEGDTPGIVHHERCTREDVPGIVKMLLRGLGNQAPVTEEQIEVWSCVSKPTLEVKF